MPCPQIALHASKRSAGRAVVRTSEKFTRDFRTRGEIGRGRNFRAASRRSCGAWWRSWRPPRERRASCAPPWQTRCPAPPSSLSGGFRVSAPPRIAESLAATIPAVIQPSFGASPALACVSRMVGGQRKEHAPIRPERSNTDAGEMRLQQTQRLSPGPKPGRAAPRTGQMRQQSSPRCRFGFCWERKKRV
jgi:hypothetical protein